MSTSATAPCPASRDRLQLQAISRQVARLAAAAEPPWLHQEVARRMDERLGWIRREPTVIADWWSHAGGGATLLGQRYPQAVVHRVEPPLRAGSPSVSLAGTPWWRRWWGATGIERPYFGDDASHWQWPGSADASEGVGRPSVRDMPQAQLLWANMMLHWAESPADVMSQWFDALEEDGILMFSCLGPDTARELAPVYAAAGWGPAAAPLLDMHDMGDVLVKTGFRDPVMSMEHITLQWADPIACLAELRTLGQNLHPARHTGLRTPRWRDALTERLSLSSEKNPVDGVPKRLHTDALTSLTFEVIYGHAVRGSARATVAPTTEISLDTMRRMVRGRGV